MSDEDSSSEEDTEKLKEATWSFVPAKTSGSRNGHSNDCDKKDTQSRRAVASVHENDGNELQTTPEFRAHVAKKLGFVLDSCISEVPVPAVGSSNLLSGQEKEVEEDDEGFRLFSTSVPGVCAPAPSLKRRPVPSSSDSDSEFETRIREAAVTISDIVRPYYTEKTEEKKDSGVALENNVDTCESLDVEGKIHRKKRKKKKKKILKLEEDNKDERKESPDDGNAQSQEGTQTSQPEEMKKKKKKVKVAQWNGE